MPSDPNEAFNVPDLFDVEDVEKMDDALAAFRSAADEFRMKQGEAAKYLEVYNSWTMVGKQLLDMGIKIAPVLTEMAFSSDKTAESVDCANKTNCAISDLAEFLKRMTLR